MRRTVVLTLLSLSVILAACGPPPSGATFVVNSEGNGIDANTGDGMCATAEGDCTLYAAVAQANADSDANIIQFADNVDQIIVTNTLTLHSGYITIQGGGDVTLNGNDASCDFVGIHINNSNGNVIQGLRLTGFGTAIHIEGVADNAHSNIIGADPGNPGQANTRNVINDNCTGIAVQGPMANSNTIAGNYIGTTMNGNGANGNALVSVHLYDGAHSNLIGSNGDGQADDAERNVISGNNSALFPDAIRLSGATNNHISGNYIGVAANGNALPNIGGNGILLEAGSNSNFIGLHTNGSGLGNVISNNQDNNNGHGGQGILIEDSTQNLIAGNLIGVSPDGNNAMGNANHGIWVTVNALTNIIGTNGDGTNDAAEGNVISGNLRSGVRLQSTFNTVAGNYIGTNAAGTAALPNMAPGLSVEDLYNTVGTDGDGVSDDLEGNLISGNLTNGIFLGTQLARISGNLVGTDVTGTSAIPNQDSGIHLSAFAQNNLIGTDGDGQSDTLERNVVSGNGGMGIALNAAARNTFAGNYIGVDSSGTAALPNADSGISIANGALNVIGTNGDGQGDAVEGNLVSGNGFVGVWLQGAQETTVAGNLIGTDAAGTAALPNNHASDNSAGGVLLSHGAANNVIGTNGDGVSDALERNVISGNHGHGVSLNGTSGGPTANVVAGNLIGVDVSGAAGLSNSLDGVSLTNGAANNLIGTNADGTSDALEANVIGTNFSGVTISEASDNTIAGNFIGTDLSGTADLGNQQYGVHMQTFEGSDPASGNAVGGSPEQANTIAYNGLDGVAVVGSGGVYPDHTSTLSNAIHDNGELGIDLWNVDLEGEANTQGVTPNDAGDGDDGPNDLMNFPLLNAALTNANQTSISGEIVAGLPNTTFLVQFFANDSCDPSGHGEGQVFLGESVETTDGAGNATFIVTFNQPVAVGAALSSTATTDDTTSEFSPCVLAEESLSLSIPLESATPLPTWTPSPTITPRPTETPTATAAPQPQCNDGIDNDGDGGIDYGTTEEVASGEADRECSSLRDTDESQ